MEGLTRINFAEYNQERLFTINNARHFAHPITIVHTQRAKANAGIPHKKIKIKRDGRMKESRVALAFTL